MSAAVGDKTADLPEPGIAAIRIPPAGGEARPLRPARDYLGDKLSVAKDKIGDLQNVDYRQVADDAKQYARQNPGQALMISAAAGFLLGLLLRSSRR